MKAKTKRKREKAVCHIVSAQNFLLRAQDGEKGISYDCKLSKYLKSTGIKVKKNVWRLHTTVVITKDNIT